MMRPLIIKNPEPDLEVRTYLVRRREKPDDVLEGEGLYFRTRDRGGLIVFDRHGLSMSTYEKGDWVSIEDRTPRTWVVNNVTDRRAGWVGSWEVEAVRWDELTDGDSGTVDVIYQDHGRAEAGTLSSWNETTAWVRFNHGETAAGCNRGDLVRGLRKVPLEEMGR